MSEQTQYPLYRFETLNPQHRVAGFRSGATALDTFIQNDAWANMEQNLSHTTVLLQREPNLTHSVVGYFTLIAASEHIPSTEPGARHTIPLPVVELAYLARHVNVSYKNSGESFGDIILVRALRQVLEAADLIGIAGLQIMKHTREGRKLYERHSFHKHPANWHDAYFLSIPEIRLDVANY